MELLLKSHMCHFKWCSIEYIYIIIIKQKQVVYMFINYVLFIVMQ